MTSPFRAVAAIAAGALSISGLSVLALASPARAAAPDIQITEIAYGGLASGANGGDGEYVEITNEGDAAQDLTGWTYATGTATPAAAGAVSLSALGTLAPGASAIITDLSAAEFRIEWALKSSVKVLDNGKLATLNSGASAAWVLDGSNTTVDTVAYPAKGATGAFTGKGQALVATSALSSQSTASGWAVATAGDAEGSWASVKGAIGSPGSSTYGTSTPAGVRAAADLQITEIAYGGKVAGSADGEYVEVTNVGEAPQDLTGWSYSANKSTTVPAAGVVDLSALGTIAAGESFLITDLTADAFRTEWNLKPTVKVINDGATTINSGAIRLAIFNGSTLVDSLGWAAGYLTAKGVAAFVNAGHLGDTDTTTAGAWTTPTTTTDTEGSWTSATGSIGSPGASTLGTSTPASVRAPAAEDAHSVIKLGTVDTAAGTVTVTNTGSSTHDLSGWTVVNTAGTAITVPASTTLAAGASQTFTAAPNTFAANDVVKLYDGTTLVDTTTVGADPNWADVSINEVSSDNAVVIAGVTLRDPVELYNSGSVDVSMAGWKSADSGHLAALADLGPLYVNGSSTPASTPVIPAHGFAVFHSPNGLSGEGDDIQLYLPDNTLVSTLTYPTSVAGTDNGGVYSSVAACPDGSTTYLKVKAATFGTSNATACATGEALTSTTPTSDVPCDTEAPAATTNPVSGTLAWPGSASVTVADEECAWDGGGTQQDLSGLVFDPTDPSTLWAVKNKSVVYKLTKTGGVWQKVTTDGWSAGKALRFPGGTGLPDTEGMTVGPDGALYITTERDNAANTTPLDTVLRFDPSGSGTTLTATDEWDLTGDVFPAKDSADANLGFEGVTYVPDSYLTANGFIDDATGTFYKPASYPTKVTAGLFFGAVEKTGHLRAYALKADHTFTRVADIATGMAGVMDVSYDADLQRIWAQCDNTCGVALSLLKIGADGHFTTEKQYARPAGLPDNNLEGFAVAPVATAVSGQREAVWSDDGNFGTSTTGLSMLADDGGHSVWSGLMDVDLGLGSQGYVDLPITTTGTLSAGTAAKVGVPLTPTSTLAFTPAATVTYQWVVGGTAVGAPSATLTSYKPVARDAGKTILVRALAVREGYTDKVVDSAALTVAAASAVKPPVVTPPTKAEQAVIKASAKVKQAAAKVTSLKAQIKAAKKAHRSAKAKRLSKKLTAAKKQLKKRRAALAKAKKVAQK